MDPAAVLDPVLEHGFPGLAAVLLALHVWLLRRLLGLLEETTLVIRESTATLRMIDARSVEVIRLAEDLRTRLLARPCIADAERKRA